MTRFWIACPEPLHIFMVMHIFRFSPHLPPSPTFLDFPAHYTIMIRRHIKEIKE